MDARKILDDVAAKYAGLTTLAVEGFAATDSGDENASTSQRTRVKAWYAAPAQVRMERAGRGGSVTVSDGAEVIRYPLLPNRYSKRPVNAMNSVGQFDPKHPDRGDVFLFPGIAEKIAHAEYLGRDDDRHRITVTYIPAHPQMARLHTCSPIRFHVDAHSNLIVRMEFETTHRMPAHDEIQSTRHNVEYLSSVADQPIAPEVFRYKLPADAIEMPAGGGFIGGVGGGGRLKDGHETWHTTQWEGSTLVETFKLRFEGMDLTLLRRLTFSEDRRELRIVERLEGPKEPAGCEFVAPLKD